MALNGDDAVRARERPEMGYFGIIHVNLVRAKTLDVGRFARPFQIRRSVETRDSADDANDIFDADVISGTQNCSAQCILVVGIVERITSARLSVANKGSVKPHRQSSCLGATRVHADDVLHLLIMNGAKDELES